MLPTAATALSAKCNNIQIPKFRTEHFSSFVCSCVLHADAISRPRKGDPTLSGVKHFGLASHSVTLCAYRHPYAGERSNSNFSLQAPLRWWAVELQFFKLPFILFCNPPMTIKAMFFLTILAKYKNYTTFFILFLKTLKLHDLFNIFLDKALQAPVTGGGRMQCRYAFFAHFISSACRLVLLSNFCFKSAAGIKISRRAYRHYSVSERSYKHFYKHFLPI